MKHKNYKTKYNLSALQNSVKLVYKGLFVAKAEAIQTARKLKSLKISYHNHIKC